ncbi:hypothetical protein V6N13_093208 [Hibiscus sabdariffa]
MGVCRRARKLAKDDINGNYKYEFKRLFDYANALKRADNDGTIDLLGLIDVVGTVSRIKATSEADFRKQAAAVGEVKGRALLIGDRHMSIISMFEEIRHYVMERNVKKKNSCMKWKSPICPIIYAKVEEHRELSSFCHVSWNGDDGYDFSNVGNEGNTSESIPNLLFILSLRIMCLICHPLAPQALRMSLQAEPPPQLHQHPCSNRRTPPTPHCSTEPPIPHVPTPTATPHVSTVHVPSNKKKGKEKVFGHFPKSATRGRKIIE